MVGRYSTENSGFAERILRASAGEAWAKGKPAMDVGDMMQVWKELLLVDEVQPTSDFFELGGHSMLAIRLVRRLRKQFGVKIAPAAVMDYPTPEELTRVARQAPRVSP